MNRIIGIDPGSALCGWAVIEAEPGRQGKLIASGCIKTSPKDTTAKRLEILYNELQDIIKKYHPHDGAVEELFFVQNIKTGIVVGQARGAILLALSKAGLPVYEYKPTVVKMALTGYGRAEKKQVQSMVKLMLKLDKEITQDDEADAVAVAICHSNHANNAIANDTRISHSNRTVTNDARISDANKIITNRTYNKLVYPELSYKVVGVLQRVSNEIGFVLNERYYYPFIEKELKGKGIVFEKQVPVVISIEGIRGRYYFDYLIDDKIVLEIKIGSRFSKKDVDQVMAYLRSTGKKLGMLARFTRSGVLIKRFLLGNNSH